MKTSKESKEMLIEIIEQDRLGDRIMTLRPDEVKIVAAYVQKVIETRLPRESRAHKAMEELEGLPR